MEAVSASQASTKKQVNPMSSGNTCRGGAGTNVTSLLDEVDTILSGADATVDQKKMGTVLSEAMGSPPRAEVPPSELFSTYLLSPAYFAQTEDLLLVKTVTAKGEPFYLLDPKKESLSIVCGLTEVFLAAYDAETACVDECEGFPALHIVPDCIAEELLTKALRGICTARWFSGLVFISSVSVQFYYKTCDSSMVSSVFRVASDNEGRIEARDVRGAVTCDYPVPYLVVDEALFAGGLHSVEIVESLSQANINLIDSLCRIAYKPLHEGEKYPDDLDNLLGKFMGTHSHLVKNLLEAQRLGSSCDDAFVRRQRKGEIDVLVRLMMREVELMKELKKTLEEMEYIGKAIKECPPCTAPELDYQDQEDVIIRPRLSMPNEETKSRSDCVLSGREEVSDLLSKPISDSEDEGKIANAELMGSLSSGSDCSR